MNSLGKTAHNIYYDSVSRWVRWDRSGNLEKLGVQETIITWTDYNKLIEYVYFVDRNSCEQYGPDAFYPWCYGADFEQENIGSITVAGLPATQWAQQQGGPFQWTSLDKNCLPLTTMEIGFFTTSFFNTTVGPSSPQTWKLPDICTRKEVKLAGKNPISRRQIHV